MGLPGHTDLPVVSPGSPGKDWGSFLPSRWAAALRLRQGEGSFFSRELGTIFGHLDRKIKNEGNGLSPLKPPGPPSVFSEGSV